MRILDKIGMCRAYKGYVFWEEAISIVKRKQRNIINMQEIYRKISEKYNVSSASVERGMYRTLIKIPNLEKKLKSDYRLTTKKVLALLATKQKGEEDE